MIEAAIHRKKESIVEKTEQGVMVMKNGKAWGIVKQEVGSFTIFGWVKPAEAILYPQTLQVPSQVLTVRNDPHEMEDAKIVPVERKTTITEIK